MKRAGVLALAEALEACGRMARALADEEPAQEPPDELILVAPEPLNARGFEFRPVVRAVESGALRSVKIGRPRYTKLKWLVAWAETLPTFVAADPVDDLAVAARRRAIRRAS